MRAQPSSPHGLPHYATLPLSTAHRFPPPRTNPHQLHKTSPVMVSVLTTQGSLLTTQNFSPHRPSPVTQDPHQPHQSLFATTRFFLTTWPSSLCHATPLNRTQVSSTTHKPSPTTQNFPPPRELSSLNPLSTASQSNWLHRKITAPPSTKSST
ncbi:hypothetical protein BWD121_012300 [Bartonella sp. WD12.1]|nr:hypothetical protein BWD121_012300 [Bartonella sp. WD12.1]